MADDSTETTTSEQTQTETSPNDEAAAVASDQAAGDETTGGDEGEAGDKSLMNGGATDGDEAEGDEGKDEEAAEQPPEKYELKLRDDLEMTDDILAEVDPVFRELGLTNDQANKLAPLVESFADRIQQAGVDAHLATAAQWAKDAKADPDIGKGNWTETEALVASALDRFVGPKVVKDKDGNEQPNAFRKLLDDTKLGNHPAMIRAFRDIGRAISEDTSFVRSDAAAPEKKSREEVLYPNDVKKEVSA